MHVNKYTKIQINKKNMVFLLIPGCITYGMLAPPHWYRGGVHAPISLQEMELIPGWQWRGESSPYTTSTLSSSLKTHSAFSGSIHTIFHLSSDILEDIGGSLANTMR